MFEEQRTYVDTLQLLVQGQPYPPVTPMWVAGGVNREAWHGFKFRQGMLLEGAIRDDDGKAQGTVILEVLDSLSTDAKGHWIHGRYVAASDPHMRWWMSEGAGKGLAKKCAYHCCEVPSIDCPVSRRGAAIHLERFRALTQKEIDRKVPSWAFEKELGGSFLKYLKGRKLEPEKEEAAGALPWVDPGGEDSEEEGSESGEDSSGDKGLRAKLLKAKHEVGKLEKELLAMKSLKKAAKKKLKKKKPKKAHDKEEKEAHASEEKTGGKKSKEKKRKPSPSSGGAKKKKRTTGSGKKKEAKETKDKRKTMSDTSSEEDLESGEGLFGADPVKGRPASGANTRKDRGPFGGGDIVRYRGESSSESEGVFREAPAAPKASNQLKLIQYSKKTPGRLASRLLLKMQTEGALGAVGASPAEVGEMTPPAAVHYFHTMIVPQLGPKLTFRAHRELRTLCTVLDLLARKQPAHAADLVGQRVKAIEKSCHDGHWAAAQYLELLGPDGGGLLERDEEVFMNREHLLDLKLKGWQPPRGDKDGRGHREKGGKKGKDKGKGKGESKDKDKKD